MKVTGLCRGKRGPMCCGGGASSSVGCHQSFSTSWPGRFGARGLWPLGDSDSFLDSRPSNVQELL